VRGGVVILNQPKPDDRLDPKGNGLKAYRAHSRWAFTHEETRHKAPS
jgi:hypothetical protein